MSPQLLGSLRQKGLHFQASTGKSSQDSILLERAGMGVEAYKYHPNYSEKCKIGLQSIPAWAKKQDLISKITRVKRNWRCGSSSTASA
jgi:hypothetical protein